MVDDAPDARVWLAAALLRQRRFAEAGTALQDAERVGHRVPRLAARIKAALALEAGRLDQAERLYRELGAGGDARARIGLALVRARAGQWEVARVELDAAAAALPALAVVFYDRALAHRALGDPASALVDAERAVALDPLFPEARNNLAALYIDAGQFEWAGLWLEQTVAMAPEYAAAWGNLGALRLLQGDVAGALVALARAAERDPGSPTHALNLGLAYHRGGDPAAARRELRRAIRLDPDNAAARRMLRFLEGLEKGELWGEPPVAIAPTEGAPTEELVIE
jgi:tetratricopeptide (TPR) repeat protein